MKKIFLIIVALFACSTIMQAQERTKISDGLYIVNYAGTYVIEDDVNQRSISISISQENKEKQSDETIYKVVCGKWVKRTIKDGLKLAIAGGIAASGASQGASLIISAASTLALYIYDDYCEKLEKRQK